MMGFEAINSFFSQEKIGSRETVRVTKDSRIVEVDEPTYARVVGSDFHNGVIEVKVLSRLLPNAPDFARGFIGVAFRINDANSQFESLYLRPTNARAEDQMRRNASVQYFSYPEYKFDRLRQEFPRKFETYADMGLGEWITMRIEVKDSLAKLFLNGGQHPTLIVSHLFHGRGKPGGVGLWVDIGTEGFFADLNITPQ